MPQDKRFKKPEPKYTIDIEAMAGRSLHYDRLGVPGINPLAAVLSLVDKTQRPGFHRDSWCRDCTSWKKGERPVRPVATDPTVSCNGCYLGYLDEVPGLALDELRDRLFGRWARAREQLRQVNLAARECFSPEEKAANRRERQLAEDELRRAAEDCKAAGFSPTKRARSRVRVMHEEPPSPRAEHIRPTGPHWTGSAEEGCQ